MTSKDLLLSIVGKTISHYRILERISAEGAQGEVYKAEDIQIRSRVVALKFLAPTLATDKDSVARIRREAEAIARLDHPNIVTIYEFAWHHDLPFLCMQYLEGGSLRDLVRKGPLSVEETVRIGAQLAAALSYAHARGVIHCDVKPANVMVTTGGHVKLADFGLAEIEQQTKIGSDGLIKGTLAYMAPEVLSQERPTEQSDIYSLGVVLYELVTGVKPFQSNDIRGLVHVLSVIDVLSCVHISKDRLPCLRMCPGPQLPHDLFPKLPVFFSLRYGSLRFAAAHVQVYAGVADTVRLRARPIHVLQ